jgi:hypothetical protein
MTMEAVGARDHRVLGVDLSRGRLLGCVKNVSILGNGDMAVRDILGMVVGEL